MKLEYITLTEAEELSGIKADTLKKRCQEGKLSGAVKQGNTWFVPKDAIIKSFESPTIDLMLSTLARIAEAVAGIDITLFIKGVIISGDLIPAKEYIRISKEKLNNSPQKQAIPEETYKLFDQVFELFEKHLPKTAEEVADKPLVTIHLKNVRYKTGDTWSNEVTDVIRIKLSAVDGFLWGKAS